MPISLPRIPLLPTCAVAALVVACAAAVGDAGARPRSASLMQRDTTLEFATGDRVRVSSWPMGANGIEVCAALTQGVRGSGKTLYAQGDQGAGLPTTQRFPSAGTTPYCSRLVETGGDSMTVTFTKLVLDRQGRYGRLTLGSHRMALEPVWRRRVTFRWLREGTDTVPAVPTVEEAYGAGRTP